MKNKKFLVAVIPAKQESVRVENKNFRNFYKGKNLLEIKIGQLKKVKLINQIVVSSDSLRAEKIAKKYDVKFHKREKYYTSSTCSGSKFYENLAKSIDCKYLFYAPCTSPMIKPKTYTDFIKHYFKVNKEFESLNTVKIIKSHIWKGQKPLNYNSSTAPNSQDLPNNFYSLTYGANIMLRDNIIKYKNIVGKKVKFYPVNEIEATDIDTLLDFELAKMIFKKYPNF